MVSIDIFDDIVIVSPKDNSGGYRNCSFRVAVRC
jgi:hypothetical protein